MVFSESDIIISVKIRAISFFSETPLLLQIINCSLPKCRILLAFFDTVLRGAAYYFTDHVQLMKDRKPIVGRYCSHVPMNLLNSGTDNVIDE